MAHHQQHAQRPVHQQPISQVPLQHPIEARPMTAGPDGEMVEMQGEELKAFWDKHCPATMGGHCHPDAKGKCTHCGRVVPK